MSDSLLQRYKKRASSSSCFLGNFFSQRKSVLKRQKVDVHSIGLRLMDKKNTVSDSDEKKTISAFFSLQRMLLLDEKEKRKILTRIQFSKMEEVHLHPLSGDDDRNLIKQQVIIYREMGYMSMKDESTVNVSFQSICHRVRGSILAVP